MQSIQVESSGFAHAHQRRAKRDANMAAYKRRKQRDPFLETRLSLLGLVNGQSHETSIDSQKDQRVSEEIDPNGDMAESAAVRSPAFGLTIPYNTMSSILSDVSFEEGSLRSQSISHQSVMAVDEMHRRESDGMESKQQQHDSDHIHSQNGNQFSSLNPPSTPRNESTNSTLLPYVQASPAITDNSRASSGSTVNTSILFPNRESQRSSLGMLLVANQDIFPQPPVRLGYDTFSNDETMLTRGTLDMDEETPKAKPIQIDEFDYRNKPLPAIRDSSEDDRTIRQSNPSSPPLPATMKDSTNFLHAHNAIGLLLVPASGEPNTASEPVG